MSRVWTRVALLAVLTATTTLAAAPAMAQPQVRTDYPAVDVAAGEQVDFDLTVTATAPERVALEVTVVPEGWMARLRAGGFNVRAVTAGPDEPVEVTLEVTIPPDAAEGSHEIVVVATSNAGTSTLPLELVVTETAGSAVTLEAEFATLQGARDDTFRYSVDLANDTPEEVTFALQARGPEGWQVSATPSTQTRANTVTVEAGGSTTVTVEATPPPGVTAGAYPLLLEVAGGGQTARIELTAEVTGFPELELATVDERLNAAGTAGDATAVDLVITNAGSAPLTGIELAATPPSDWEVAFEPATVDLVPPGETASVRALITPSSEAVVGDYVITLRATSEHSEDQLEVRFTVETSPGWGIAAVSSIAAVALGLVGVFRRYGRR